MGLDTSAIMFHCAAKSLGVDFSSTATIGRQEFWRCDPAALRRVFAVLGIDRDAEEFLRRHAYGEEFFSLLGAETVESVDVSSYEQATILHDMNLPLPPELRERFTVVHDGGSLEHVFNIPQAFKNCMEMVRVDGHFTQVTVANNFTGHGFWQISPELIFRVFSQANGYQVEAVLMHEVIPGGAWYFVSDPEQVHRRVELRNSQPTYILTIARRIATVEIFSNPPQQSDYVDIWDKTLKQPERAESTTSPSGYFATWKSHIPQPVKRSIRSIVRQIARDENTRGFSSTSYHRISDDDLLHGRLPARLSSPGTPAEIE